LSLDSCTSTDTLPDWQRRFLLDHRLPGAYLQTARRFFDPLVERLAGDAGAGKGALLVAVNGSQGSGKSTLCAYLVAALSQARGLRAAALSLDDFYLTRDERRALAESVHPLLETRGVPGTHDTALLSSTLEQLRDGCSGELAVPAFDKARDDRCPQGAWPRYQLPLDVVILEGWCLGARSEDASALSLPLNPLERDEDPSGLWRGYSNECLRRDYEPLYGLFQRWIMLAAPSFEQVLAWRSEQEAKLAERVSGKGEGLMDAAALQRFVAHFERFTRRCLSDLPGRVDVLYQLDERRSVVGLRGLGESE